MRFSMPHHTHHALRHYPGRIFRLSAVQNVKLVRGYYIPWRSMDGLDASAVIFILRITLWFFLSASYYVHLKKKRETWTNDGVDNCRLHECIICTCVCGVEVERGTFFPQWNCRMSVCWVCALCRWWMVHMSSLLGVALHYAFELHRQVVKVAEIAKSFQQIFNKKKLARTHAF